MSVCTVVEILLDLDVEMDLTNMIEKITETDLMGFDEHNKQWTFVGTGDLAYWFDSASMGDHDHDEDCDDDHEDEDETNSLGVIIQGPQKAKTASSMVNWVLENAKTLGLEIEQYTIMTYFTEVDDDEIESIA